MAEKTGQIFYDSIGIAPNKRNAYTVHNGKSHRRYYASNDADILFNGHLLEELIQIQWSENQQTMPLFGYNSYTFDEIAQGSRIIQGQFAINFIVPDYLNQILEDNVQDENVILKSSAAVHKSNDRAPHFSTKIDIAIYYGEKNKKDHFLGEAPGVILKDCYITSEGQVLDTQGQGLSELYSFVAKDKENLR